MDIQLTRTGLPEHLRVLADKYPRGEWESHGNFDELTRFWLDRHLMFRDVLARLTDDVQAHLGKSVEASVFASRSARLTGFFLNQLHHHHQIEDQHYFPLLSGFDERLAPGFELLESDHKELDQNIHALADTTNAMLRALQEGQASDDAAKVHDLLIGFHGFMDRHLSDEEDLVVPTILEYGPPDIG